nr:hypothetical protein [Tanacetum cinerariifolium]
GLLRGGSSYTYIRDLVWRLCHRLISYNISEKGHAPEKVAATDLFYLRSMDRGAANVSYLLAQNLFRHVEGRKSGAKAAEDAPAVDKGAQADPAPVQAPQSPPPPSAV